MSANPGRIIGVLIGAVTILAVGVYGPAMLLGPLPEASVALDTTHTAATDEATPATSPITMPEDGTSAIGFTTDDGTVELVATSANADAVPIGGVAKLVTVLVTLDSLPLTADSAGPEIRINAPDYSDYLRLQSEGALTVPVSPGDVWNERDVVRAVMLGSSNNLANALARWAFGDIDAYVDAANVWLDDNGYEHTQIADTTGLSGDNVGTAEEATRLAAAVLANSELRAMLDGTEPSAVVNRNISDAIARDIVEGVRSISRSYTDEAGLCYIFTAQISVDGDSSRTLVGAMLRMPDYDTLDPAVRDAVEGLSGAAEPVTVIEAGQSYGSVSTAWGETAQLIATATRTQSGWSAAPSRPTITIEPFVSVVERDEVGNVTVQTGDTEVSAPLAVSTTLGEPGPLWRLSHPAVLIEAFLKGQQ